MKRSGNLFNNFIVTNKSHLKWKNEGVWGVWFIGSKRSPLFTCDRIEAKNVETKIGVNVNSIHIFNSSNNRSFSWILFFYKRHIILPSKQMTHLGRDTGMIGQQIREAPKEQKANRLWYFDQLTFWGPQTGMKRERNAWSREWEGRGGPREQLVNYAATAWL